MLLIVTCYVNLQVLFIKVSMSIFCHLCSLQSTKTQFLATFVSFKCHTKCVFDLYLNQMHQYTEQIQMCYFSNGQIQIRASLCLNQKGSVLVCFSGSTSCTFHVLTPNRPLVLSGNEHLTFAPYHTHYPKLEEHMADAGLQAKPNLWDNPLSIGRSPLSYRRSSTDC